MAGEDGQVEGVDVCLQPPEQGGEGGRQDFLGLPRRQEGLQEPQVEAELEGEVLGESVLREGGVVGEQEGEEGGGGQGEAGGGEGGGGAGGGGGGG